MSEILLSNGLVCLVDDDDYEELSQFKWHYNNTHYASRNIWDGKTETNRTELMHRKLMGLTPADKDKLIDHKNGNGLDNRRDNLRICDKTQNQCNQKPRRNSSSKYKGLTYMPGRKKCWAVRVCYRGKTRSGGYYEKEQDAALAYNKLAKEIHGEFAWLNKVPEED